MGGLGVRFESENQVSRIGHADFPILGNVAYDAVKSDFLDEALRRKCTEQLNSPEIHPR